MVALKDFAMVDWMASLLADLTAAMSVLERVDCLVIGKGYEMVG